MKPRTHKRPAPKVDRRARVHWNMRLDVELLEALDELATRLNVTRSEAVRLVLTRALLAEDDGTEET